MSMEEMLQKIEVSIISLIYCTSLKVMSLALSINATPPTGQVK